jgi:hypothetical protein
MRPKLSNDEWTALRRFTILMAASYPVLVLVGAVALIYNQRIVRALWRLVGGMTLPEQPPTAWWQPLRADWPELLYGPAIVLACVWVMLMIENLIRLRLRRR